MIKFEKRILSNGLRVIVHEDHSTPMAAVSVLYDVGSRDENAARTGFAHLFEHLMFSGSKNVEDFDIPIQLAGGENNAFTNADMTNFYEILPSENIETALWLESDRMKHLNITQKSLDIQKKVVVEEFKETSINPPYGDLWHQMSDLAYTTHPYRWPTIGLVPQHIEEATLDDVKHFYNKFYHPGNAMIIIAGNVTTDSTFSLVEKWFGDIPPNKVYQRNLPHEPAQTEYRSKKIKRKVPSVYINKAFHMPGRLHEDYYVYDLLSDVLSNGVSSRLYRRLVKNNPIFSDIDAFITATHDPGLFIIAGKPLENISLETARQSLKGEIDQLTDIDLTEKELTKLKNKAESTLIFSEISILHKAMSLAYFEAIGDANEINKEADRYRSITVKDMRRVARNTFKTSNCSELIYIPEE